MVAPAVGKSTASPIALEVAEERELQPWQGHVSPLHFLIFLYNHFLLIQLIVCK